MQSVSVIDSHTGGEPTRVILNGAPETHGSMQQRLNWLRDNRDDFRKSILLEPRGSDVLVGALLTEPHQPDCHSGVIFMNNAGYLGMCGHGLIGVVSTLLHLNRISPGNHLFDTAVGTVPVTLHNDGSVTLTNVPSYRTVADFSVHVDVIGEVIGDIAWGGNCFYLVKSPVPELGMNRINDLLASARAIKWALHNAGHPEVDHIEFFGPGQSGGNSRNFVLCPGNAYDRSPCGTGTSAKLACLATDGLLAENSVWIQESIVGSSFRCSYEWHDKEKGIILPHITGKAYIMAETILLFANDDPFANGIS